jgi:hypothetical protein
LLSHSKVYVLKLKNSILTELASRKIKIKKEEGKKHMGHGQKQRSSHPWICLRFFYKKKPE